MGWSVLAIGFGRETIKNVIRAEVNDSSPERPRDSPQLPHGVSIYAERGIGLGLGAIDGGVRGGVDNDIGPDARHGCGQGPGVSDIQLRPRESDQRGPWGDRGREVMTEHPSRTEKHRAHQRFLRYSALLAR